MFCRAAMCVGVLYVLLYVLLCAVVAFRSARVSTERTCLYWPLQCGLCLQCCRSACHYVGGSLCHCVTTTTSPSSPASYAYTFIHNNIKQLFTDTHTHIWLLGLSHQRAAAQNRGTTRSTHWLDASAHAYYVARVKPSDAMFRCVCSHLCTSATRFYVFVCSLAR